MQGGFFCSLWVPVLVVLNISSAIYIARFGSGVDSVVNLLLQVYNAV